MVFSNANQKISDVQETQIVLALIRSTSASARLAANDLDAIGIMLKAGLISTEDAAEELAELGLLKLAPTEVAAA
jgi:hypothetical protein